MEKVPTDQYPNQQFEVILNDQNCTIIIYQRTGHMYMTLYVDNTVIRQGQLMIPREPILTEPNDFDGNFYIVDTYTDAEYQTIPDYELLNDRYVLYYVTGDERQEIKDYIDEEAGVI